MNNEDGDIGCEGKGGRIPQFARDIRGALKLPKISGRRGGGHTSGMIGGLLFFFAYLSFGAYPERSHAAWFLFYILIVAIFILVRLLRFWVSAYIFFLPFLCWHFFWLFVNLWYGKFCELCLLGILLSIFLLVLIEGISKIKGMRREE